MKRFSITLFLCGLLTSGFSQSSSKKDNIKNLLELTGSGKLGVQVGQNMINSFKKSYPNVPVEFWDDFLKEMNSDTLINLIIPIYDKYYTESEIKQLSEFYQSSLGKKVISTMPLVVKESMQVGQTWGKEIGEKVYSDLKEKGFAPKE
ncbi:DUF2059 domain-containing protein [Flavobacterium sp. 83]|uniref:DUF2059 domain-containing protein n=1 Tax=Flavobacterium sp. 83 TaxID=1131812 RepID=UPI000555F572|nr:DUF2059 domain-containing protein [Flavobacterium sp. 83]